MLKSGDSGQKADILDGKPAPRHWHWWTVEFCLVIPGHMTSFQNGQKLTALLGFWSNGFISFPHLGQKMVAMLFLSMIASPGKSMKKILFLSLLQASVAVKPIIAGTFFGYPMAIASWVCCTEGRIWWPDCYRPSPIPEPVRERRALCPHGCNFRCCSRILST